VIAKHITLAAPAFRTGRWAEPAEYQPFDPRSLAVDEILRKLAKRKRGQEVADTEQHPDVLLSDAPLANQAPATPCAREGCMRNARPATKRGPKPKYCSDECYEAACVASNARTKLQRAAANRGQRDS
jgi:hypothetical protein